MINLKHDEFIKMSDILFQSHFVYSAELPPLRDPASGRGCGWTGVSLSLLLIVAIWYANQYLQPVVIRSPLTWIMEQPPFGLITKGIYIIIAYLVVKPQEM